MILRTGNLSRSLLSFNSSHPFSLLKFCPGMCKQTLSIFRLQWFTFTGQMICVIINSFCQNNKANCYFIPPTSPNPISTTICDCWFFSPILSPRGFHYLIHEAAEGCTQRYFFSCRRFREITWLQHESSFVVVQPRLTLTSEHRNLALHLTLKSEYCTE